MTMENLEKQRNEKVRFPKNIRQIGQIAPEHRIYVEDYVITYLNRILNEEEMGSRAVLLLGHAQTQNGNSSYYIYGAVCSEKMRLEEGQPLFDEDDKEFLLTMKEEYFGELDILGWALLENEFNCITDDGVWKNGNGPFGNQNKLFLRSDMSGRQERFKLYENGLVLNIPGYAVFYDKNEEMQAYLINWHKERRETSIESVKDTAARQFRSVIMEKQEGNYQKKAMSFFYLASTMLMIVLCATGITMVNQYDKMKHIETAMNHLTETMEDEGEYALPAMAEPAVIPETEPAGVSENTALDLETAAREENIQFIVSEVASEKAEMTEEKVNAEDQSIDTAEEIAVAEEPAETGQEIEAATADGAETPAGEEPTVAAPEPQMPKEYYTKAGDTLEGISIQFYNTSEKVREICLYNNISDPNNIMCGQKILLP